MNAISVSTAILTLVAGIGAFLVACTMMSSNLESVSSKKLKQLFAKASRSRILGVGIGTVGTAAIQSSGATTVMVIGFVNAGIMSLAQAATIIYGANIGTTVTGQIVALGMFGGNTISTTVLFSAFAGIGSFLTMFAKKDLWKKIGGILAGFGLLFIGLEMMSGAMEDFAKLDAVKTFLANINNAVILVIVGAILTAIIQSSSVMTSIAITMVVTGLITLDQGIFLTMGSNIGSCVVALIAGLTSSRNAKRTALIHLIFNVSGVVLFLIISLILKTATGGSLSFGSIFGELFPDAPQTQLAMFHTVFNVLTMLLFLPLTNLLVMIVTMIVPEKSEDSQHEEAFHMHYVDDHMLKTPAIAVQQIKNEIVNMAELSIQNFGTSLQMICTMDDSELEQFRKNEEELDYLNAAIVDFIVRLQNLPLSQHDRRYLSYAFHTISDLERVGDYAENIVEDFSSFLKDNEHFSERAVTEIHELQAYIEELFQLVMKAYIDNDSEALKQAYKIEQKVDDITNEMALQHVERLNEGVCTPTVGARYLSLASNSERVADHYINVGKAIRANEI